MQMHTRRERSLLQLYVLSDLDSVMAILLR